MPAPSLRELLSEVRMSKVPPSQDQPDDVDDQYRRASALDPSRPSEAVRRAVLAQCRPAGREARQAEGREIKHGGDPRFSARSQRPLSPGWWLRLGF